MQLVKEVMQKAEDEKPKIVNLLSDLIEFKSITGSSDEKKAAQYIKKTMQDFGYDEVFTDSIGNVIGKIGDGPKTILYDAHLDVVDVTKEEWDTEPFSPVIKDDCIIGRGAMDDKGPLSSIIYAGKIIKDLNLAQDYTIYISASVSEETCEGLALGSFIEEFNIKPDYVVIAEASNLKICRGHRGRALVKAEFKGKSVHASMHNQGDNPLDKALPFAQAVKDLDNELTDDNILGAGDIVVTKINSNNSSLNTVPSKAEVIMDRRTNSQDDKKSILKELKKLPHGDEAEISFLMYEDESYNGYQKKGEEYFPAWILPAEDKLIESGVDTYKKLFEDEPTVSVWGFSTNGTHTMGKLGIKTIGFGPGEESCAHAENERVKISDLIKAVSFYSYLPVSLK
jgi:putative selenium metabolism hydrolase